MYLGIATIPSTCLYPKNVLENIGGFDPALPSSIDHDIWMNLAVHGYHAYAIDEPLVITYDYRSRKAMTTDVAPRIQGVRAYVEKWMPVYQEWFDETGGRVYGHRYFSRVIASLAATKLVFGYFGESLQAIFAIFRYSSETGYSIFVLLKYIILFGARRLLPHYVFDLVKRMQKT